MERRQLQPETDQTDFEGVGATSPDSSALALSPDDREWIDRIRSGNAGGLEELFRTHARPLTAFAYRYVQAYDPAMRIVHEVFTRLWKGRHSWAFHGTVRGNLFASAHRVALEELRRTRTEARWHAGLPMTNDANAELGDPLAPVELPCQGDLHERIQSAIARLPARARTVGYMRWADRLSRAEIATVLGSNVRTVHTQLTPASRAMRKRLGRAYDNAVIRLSPSTVREAERLDPFAGIDPDRIEYFLAAECIPSEGDRLRRDIAAAGGEPDALDAMESAWCGPGQIMEDLVDVDVAWRTLARRLTLPHDAMPAGERTSAAPRKTPAASSVDVVPQSSIASLLYQRARDGARWFGGTAVRGVVIAQHGVGRGAVIARHGIARGAVIVALAVVRGGTSLRRGVVRGAAATAPVVRSLVHTANIWTRRAGAAAVVHVSAYWHVTRTAVIERRHLLRTATARRIGVALGLAVAVAGVWAAVAHRSRAHAAVAHHAIKAPSLRARGGGAGSPPAAGKGKRSGGSAKATPRRHRAHARVHHPAPVPPPA